MMSNSRSLCLSAASLLLTFSWSQAEEREFTNQDGVQIRAEFVVATDTHVTIKLANGRTHVIPLESLSQHDQDYIAEAREGNVGGGSEDAEESAEVIDVDAAREEIAQFALDQKGEQVGDGECWTLANEAFKAAGLKRPTKDTRIWGVVVDHLSEKLMPGDVVELRDAKIGSFRTGPAHTAVVVKKSSRRGVATVCEQNVNGSKDVVVSDYDFRDLQSGTVTVYRFSGKEH